jgi:hypothetical protein
VPAPSISFFANLYTMFLGRTLDPFFDQLDFLFVIFVRGDSIP